MVHLPVVIINQIIVMEKNSESLALRAATAAVLWPMTAYNAIFAFS